MSNSTESPSGWSVVRASKTASRTINPIRSLTDRLVTPQTTPEKPFISLSIGDPTVYGNLKVPHKLNDILIRNVLSYEFNGYSHSCGYALSREALARKFSVEGRQLTKDDVVLTSGCSGAIELAMEVLMDEGETVLLPTPGFPLYSTIAASKGFVIRSYPLLPNKNWEVDLEKLEEMIDEKTRVIIINNPSNPCGSVYSREHLQAILDVASRNKIPVISDEIYAWMTFGSYEFVPLASIKSDVPILTVGGLAKRYIVPGWRMGWILIYDINNVFQHIRTGLLNLSTLILGPNTLMQSILPEIFEIDDKVLQPILGAIETQAIFLTTELAKIPGLSPILPHGAMYAMVRVEVSEFKDLADEVEFAQKLLSEEFVFVLPGRVFGLENYFRVVTCPPISQLTIACNRIRDFCARHHL